VRARHRNTETLSETVRRRTVLAKIKIRDTGSGAGVGYAWGRTEKFRQAGNTTKLI